mgnify:CR=1 FL=1
MALRKRYMLPTLRAKTSSGLLKKEAIGPANKNKRKEKISANKIFIFNRNQNLDLACFLSFFPMLSARNLVTVLLIPKSAMRNNVRTIVRAKEYTPNKSGKKFLAIIIVKISAPTLEIIDVNPL